MGLFSGRANAAREFAYPDIPPNSQVGNYTPSFTQMNTSDTESSLRKVAVFASTNLLAGLASSLPLDGYTGRGADKRAVSLPVFFTDPDGTGQGLEDWLYMLLYCWLLRGNAVGRVLDRDIQGHPTQILLAHPDRVTVYEAKDGPAWHIDGVRVPKEELWHRRVFPVPGRRMGLSPISLHALTISQGLAAAAFGLRWFSDGGHPSAILQDELHDKVDQSIATVVKQRFLSAVRGTREPVVIGKGWKYQAIQINPEESQFLDTQKYSAAECARIFGPGVPEVLGYDTGGSMTYTNIEQRSIDLLKFTLDRWLVRAERVLSADMLPRPRYVKFNRGALLATDLLTRYRSYEIGLRNKFLVVDEVRDTEDKGPVEWGAAPTESAPAPTTVQIQE